ncbi:MAG: DUF3152 domain-containing protein [Myxococcota bacterium]|nr:DUF3152 domain-containing protein [Myxococcota bacterium]
MLQILSTTFSILAAPTLVPAPTVLMAPPHAPVHGARSRRKRSERRMRPKYQTASGQRKPQNPEGKLTTYKVMVEKSTGYPIEKFAQEVEEILLDERGWQASGKVTFWRKKKARIRIILATPATVDRLCRPLNTNGYVSCHKQGTVALNVARWRENAAAFPGDLQAYRTYLINHEVGHALGQRHRYCKRDGSPVPVMHPQTYGFINCADNFWPLNNELTRIRGPRRWKIR